MSWTVEFHPKARREFRDLPPEFQARFTGLFDRLQAHGLELLGMPHARHIQGKVWELRAKGSDGIARVLYVTRQGQRLVALRAFVKKSQKTPPNEIRTALQRETEI